jgi:putative transposase
LASTRRDRDEIRTALLGDVKLHNAVRHGYVERWQDWPYSNAVQYLADIGTEEAKRRWREYPLLDYGNHWDPPEL